METLKVSGDLPQPRFGHTITLVTDSKAVLFGGAVGEYGKYSIRGEAFLFECLNKTWKKLNPSGSLPAARAAHSSTAVETNQLIIYGGATGGGQLVSDDLYLLDLKNGDDKAQWAIVPVVGKTPGRRYGHTIVFFKPNLIVFGGNVGNEPVNDVWLLNVEKGPFSWKKLDFETNQICPSKRVYHSAALCTSGTASGMMVVFGGRGSDQKSNNEAWGLRRHRDGKWDWVKAPYNATGEQPTARFQHNSLFLGSYMIVVGGRTNTLGETVPLEIYDCESSDWNKYNVLQRFRHASWIFENALYVDGGFEQNSPDVPVETTIALDLDKYIQLPQLSKQSTLLATPQLNSKGNTTNSQQMKTGTIGGYNRDTTPVRTKKPSTAGSTQMNALSNKDIKLSEKVAIATTDLSTDDRINGIKYVSIDKLQEESRKIKPLMGNFNESMHSPKTQSIYLESIYTPFINSLLKTAKSWAPAKDNKFPFKADQIIRLIDESQKVIEAQPIVLSMRVPAKIYGNLHGQYEDLLRLFDSWGGPTEHGDIDSFDYLFLGNYVDRGKYSLEVLCLLLALKLKYPDQFHLVRGSHEDIKVNKNFGFAEECAARLGEDVNNPKSIFQKFNRLFEYMPLAALVQNKILCVHSGIGTSLQSISDIENLQRPIEVIGEPTEFSQNVVVDLLWSDPSQTDKDEEPANKSNYGIKNAVKFSTTRLKSFLAANNLTLLIRSHECVNDGFEQSANGLLMTIFSCTDYCGKFTNAASVAVIKKNFELVPKVIYPQGKNDYMYKGEEEKENTEPKTTTHGGGGGVVSKMSFQNSSWIDDNDSLKKRPATPPRLNTSTNKTGTGIKKKL